MPVKLGCVRDRFFGRIDTGHSETHHVDAFTCLCLPALRSPSDFGKTDQLGDLFQDYVYVTEGKEPFRITFSSVLQFLCASLQQNGLFCLDRGATSQYGPDDAATASVRRYV